MKKSISAILFSVAIFLSGGSTFAQSAGLFGDSAYGYADERPLVTYGQASFTNIEPPRKKQFAEQDIIRVQVKESSRYLNEADLQRQKKLNSRMAITEIFSFEGLFKMPKVSESSPPGIGGEINGQNRSNGSIEQKESITETISCKVITVYDNNTLYIEGTRCRSFGEESKRVFISGIIRPEDVDERTNTITSDRLAEFVYKDVPAGTVYDSVRRSYGVKWMDRWMPF